VSVTSSNAGGGGGTSGRTKGERWLPISCTLDAAGTEGASRVNFSDSLTAGTRWNPMVKTPFRERLQREISDPTTSTGVLTTESPFTRSRMSSLRKPWRAALQFGITLTARTKYVGPSFFPISWKPRFSDTSVYCTATLTLWTPRIAQRYEKQNNYQKKSTFRYQKKQQRSFNAFDSTAEGEATRQEKEAGGALVDDDARCLFGALGVGVARLVSSLTDARGAVEPALGWAAGEQLPRRCALGVAYRGDRRGGGRRGSGP
jgi:hypothetical protein